MTQLTKTNIDNIYVTEDARVWDDKRKVWCTVGKNKSTHYWHVSISGRAPVSLHRLMCETSPRIVTGKQIGRAHV